MKRIRRKNIDELDRKLIVLLNSDARITTARAAKTIHRSILEKALSFVKDAKVDHKGALFMWKLKQLKEEAKKNESTKK